MPAAAKRPARRPLAVHPLVQNFLTAAASAPVPTKPGRTLLRAKSLCGVTMQRYADGYEATLADGRIVSARTALGLLLALFKGR